MRCALFISDLISSLLKPGGADIIIPIFQVEKLRDSEKERDELDKQVGWNRSPRVLCSEVTKSQLWVSVQV